MGQEPTPMNQPVRTTPPATAPHGTPVPPPGVPPAPPGAQGTPATDDPEAIRQDIDRTRDEMEGTLTAINDRVNPQRVYERRTGRVRQRWTSLRSSVMGSSSSSQGAGRYYGGDDSSSWRDRTPDVDVRGRADQAKQAVSDTPQMVERQTRGNPLTAGMIAFGIGTLIGSALPDSQAERRLAREAADHVDVDSAKQRMTEHAQSVQQGVQERAQEAADDLKGSASDAAADVKQQTQQEGQRVKGDAQQSGQEVRRQA